MSEWRQIHNQRIFWGKSKICFECFDLAWFKASQWCSLSKLTLSLVFKYHSHKLGGFYSLFLICFILFLVFYFFFSLFFWEFVYLNIFASFSFINEKFVSCKKKKKSYTTNTNSTIFIFIWRNIFQRRNLIFILGCEEEKQI